MLEHGRCEETFSVLIVQVEKDLLVGGALPFAFSVHHLTFMLAEKLGILIREVLIQQVSHVR